MVKKSAAKVTPLKAVSSSKASKDPKPPKLPQISKTQKASRFAEALKAERTWKEMSMAVRAAQEAYWAEVKKVSEACGTGPFRLKGGREVNIRHRIDAYYFVDHQSRDIEAIDA